MSGLSRLKEAVEEPSRLVYDALSDPVMKQKLADMPVEKMATVAWKLVK